MLKAGADTYAKPSQNVLPTMAMPSSMAASSSDGTPGLIAAPVKIEEYDTYYKPPNTLDEQVAELQRKAKQEADELARQAAQQAAELQRKIKQAADEQARQLAEVTQENRNKGKSLRKDPPNPYGEDLPDPYGEVQPPSKRFSEPIPAKTQEERYAEFQQELNRLAEARGQRLPGRVNEDRKAALGIRNWDLGMERYNRSQALLQAELEKRLKKVSYSWELAKIAEDSSMAVDSSSQMDIDDDAYAKAYPLAFLFILKSADYLNIVLPADWMHAVSDTSWGTLQNTLRRLVKRRRQSRAISYEHEEQAVLHSNAKDVMILADILNELYGQVGRDALGGMLSIEGPAQPKLIEGAPLPPMGPSSVEEA